MKPDKATMGSFSVIGKEGSSNDGEDIVSRLWQDANSHFGEIAPLAQKDEKGNLLGVWGLMSDFSRSFLPWEEHFSKGLYLAGIQVPQDAEPPENWVKWTVPAFEYLYTKVEEEYQKTFQTVLDTMDKQGITLAGAVFDYYCPEENGQLYLFFPIRRL